MDLLTKPPGSRFGIPHAGLIARVFLSLLVAGMVAFIATMSVLVTQDSFLDCHRAAGASQPTCRIDKLYPFSIATHESVAAFAEAHVEDRVSRGRGGPTRHLVLVLDHTDGSHTEIPGIGKNGVRAPTVADDLTTFLEDATRPSARWHLRESAYPVAAVLLTMAVLFGLFLVSLGFRRTDVLFDPSRRCVSVRVGRWPLRPKIWSAPIDAIDGVERVNAFDRYGPTYSAQLTVRGGGPPGLLGLALRAVKPADDLVRRLGETLTQWRR